MSVEAITSAGPAWLFCPADRPDRYAKAAAAADVVVLDLEDGVAASDKSTARKALSRSDLDPSRTVVRLNPLGQGQQELDLDAVRAAGYRTVMLAKSESPEHVAALAPLHVVALIETPLGVIGAAQLAAVGNTIGMMWGAEDLIAGLGGRSSRGDDGGYRDVARHARSSVLLAAAAYGRFVLDAVHLDIADVDGLRAEVLDAAAAGFAGTGCIHPGQVPVVREGYRPLPQDVERAERILLAARGERGVFSFEGVMVDEPVLRHARTIVARATGK